MSKVKVTGNENVKIVFAQIFVKMDRLTSNPDPNDNRPIYIVEYISPAKMLRFLRKVNHRKMTQILRALVDRRPRFDGFDPIFVGHFVSSADRGADI